MLKFQVFSDIYQVREVTIPGSGKSGYNSSSIPDSPRTTTFYVEPINFVQINFNLLLLFYF